MGPGARPAFSTGTAIVMAVPDANAAWKLSRSGFLQRTLVMAIIVLLVDGIVGTGVGRLATDLTPRDWLTLVGGIELIQQLYRAPTALLSAMNSAARRTPSAGPPRVQAGDRFAHAALGEGIVARVDGFNGDAAVLFIDSGKAHSMNSRYLDRRNQ